MEFDEPSLVGVKGVGALLTRDIAAFAEFDEDTEGSLPFLLPELPVLMAILLLVMLVVVLLGCIDDDKLEVGDGGEV